MHLTRNWRQKIHAKIVAQRKSWNKGVFDELVCDSYATAKVYLGQGCGNKSDDKRHRTFSTLVLRGKFADPSICFANRSLGEFYYLIVCGMIQDNM